ncbi:putative lipoprotein [Treponema primitia ZAS-2]|uniref:Putative lipoprotein n=1 Tax=Treponema primitia (strain ATCC BAA-887 / DSM 12427 / ZAS-2) TaxID=545694 RepID=F5YKP2_TREPZ|nr:hypothetical protein [Treponema primitia]AEF84022.1 putative lipoprotein [Treponema primitia ZAS-2]
MRSSPFPGILTGIVVSILIVACGSTPPPQENEPPPREPQQQQSAPPAPSVPSTPAPRDPNLEPPNQEALDRLNTAVSRVETSRQQALDIESPYYRPDDWQAAEEGYDAAKNEARDTTLGELNQAVTLYEWVAEAYDYTARQSLPFFYRDLENEILQARDEAIKGGILDLSPDRLGAADKFVDQAIELYEVGEPAENYYAAAESAFEALDRYRALSMGAGAFALREEIRRRGFAKYDLDNFELADQALDRGVAAYDGGDTDLAENSAEDALLRYNRVINTGWAGAVSELQNNAEAERQRALAAKANVAARKEFGAAEDLYNRALSAMRSKQFWEASEAYTQSVPLFVQSWRVAEDKRVIAETAIRNAELRVSLSEETARDAELVLQGVAE